jgi:hypothetical protein
MSAIEASTVRLQTMADGTLRIVCDIEPRHAQDGFRLFGAPGTPIALARLLTVVEKPEKPKGGEISKWLGMRCNELEFQLWLSDTYLEACEEVTHAFQAGSGADRAACVVRMICGVDSRADIDHNPEARERFERMIRGPWSKHHLSQRA